MPETQAMKRENQTSDDNQEVKEAEVTKKPKLDPQVERGEENNRVNQDDNQSDEKPNSEQNKSVENGLANADNEVQKVSDQNDQNNQNNGAKVENDENQNENVNLSKDDNVPENTEETKKEEAKKEEAKKEEDETGVLLICGGTNWDLIGRKELPKSAKSSPQQGRNLWGPHLWAKNIRIREVVSSCTACHSVIITENGQALSFGRNDKGQLGLGDTVTRYEPTEVEALKHLKIKTAATGKGHTLFLTEDGVVYATGDNKMGQLGLGTQSSNVLTPAKISYSGKPIVRMSCGGEFSMIVDSAGTLYSFGSPEYGQLGHNSEGKFFTTGNKISYHCETSPRKVAVFIEKTREGHINPLDDVHITEIASGINHTLAVDTKNRVFTWGFAGYGRLGHNETKDELMPRNLKLFDYVNRGVQRVWAGGYFSLALDINGVLYFWGQAKASGEATMYPKPVQDLCNWQIRSVGTANKSIVVCADESVISWGPSPTYGELGYGENKAKSSTTPQEVKILDKIYVKKVTCGFGHTLMIGDDTCPNINKLPKWP